LAQYKYFSQLDGKGIQKRNLEIDSGNFEKIKKFCYGNSRNEITKENVFKLFIIANKLEFEDFEIDCETFITQHFEKLPLLEIFNLVKDLALPHLKQYCLWYLKVNFSDFNHSDLDKYLNSEDKAEVIRDQWSPITYNQAFSRWEHQMKRAQKKKNNDKSCIMQ